MTKTITWGPERTYYGSGECPADARDVPCMVKSKFGDWFGITLGRCWSWKDFIAYRLLIPAVLVRDVRDVAMPDNDAMGEIMYSSGYFADRISDTFDFFLSGDIRSAKVHFGRARQELTELANAMGYRVTPLDAVGVIDYRLPAADPVRDALVEALKFYGESDLYISFEGEDSTITCDGGKQARAALALAKGEKP